MDRELKQNRQRPAVKGPQEGSLVNARREQVVGFDPDRVAAPFLLRCMALFIDYIVLLAVPVFGLVITQLVGGKTAPPGGISWLLTTLVGLSNFIILPLLTSQTIGKMLTGLRITSKDGTPVSAVGILMRNLVGYLLTALTAGLGFLIAGLTPRGRALHDYLSGTMVIYAKRRRL